MTLISTDAEITDTSEESGDALNSETPTVEIVSLGCELGAYAGRDPLFDVI